MLESGPATLSVKGSDMIKLADTLRFSNEAADDAGQVGLRQFRKPLTVKLEADESPVTAIDREFGSLLRSRIITALGIGSNGDVLAAATPELHAQMLDDFHHFQATKAA